MKVSVFGSKVIGAERVKELTTFRAERRHKYGPLVVGDKPTLPGTTTPDPSAREVEAGLKMSVARLKETLAANPYLATTMFERELYRPRGARVEALQAIRDAIPREWVQGKALRNRIDTLLRKATADSGVVMTEEAEREGERTAKALAKKGYTQDESGKWVPPARPDEAEADEAEEEE